MVERLVTAKSDGEGRGSTFPIQLPVPKIEPTR